jgi:cell division protein FtsL
MNNFRNITQAYAQAPWRKQVQLIGLFLLILILAAMIAGIYLSVTARATTIGRSIQGIRYEVDQVERQNEDLITQLAFVTSNSEMQKRAEAQGFRPLQKDDEVLYIVVPGYDDRKPVVLANPPSPTSMDNQKLAPEYTQSLFEWLVERVLKPAAPLVEVRP